MTRGDPPKGVATVEYSKTYSDYSEMALDAMSRQKIPASKRDYVRDYFDAIRGEKAATTEDDSNP